MNLATLSTDGTTTAAEIDLAAGTATLLTADDVGDILRRRDRGDSVEARERRDLDAVAFASLVTAPGKIICVGHNYVSHIREMGRELPGYPTLFAKFADALIGARDDITLPHESSMMDWEAELAIVIGSTVRRVDLHRGAAAIAGFTVANDVSARDWQSRTIQWLQGKTFDSTTPLGPLLVEPESVDGAADLAITCTVNGETMQSARTSDLLFSPAELVSYISTVTTLRPGDVILTGTTSGVGHARTPPRYLQDGDVVSTEIEGIGTLTNCCRQDAT